MKKLKDSKLAKEQLIAASIIVFILIIGIIVLLVLNRGIEKEETTKTEKKVVQCGPITAENNVTEGKAPFAPNLKAKVSGEYSVNEPVCEWSIDGAVVFTSYIVKGYCIFNQRALGTPGEHEISYKIAKLSGCPQKIKVKALK